LRNPATVRRALRLISILLMASFCWKAYSLTSYLPSEVSTRRTT
jgi:hypothetical protein